MANGQRRYGNPRRYHLPKATCPGCGRLISYTLHKPKGATGHLRRHNDATGAECSNSEARLTYAQLIGRAG